MMPVAPEIDEAGPTREHKGSGTFSHIVSKSPNPMTPGGDVVRAVRQQTVDFPFAVGGHEVNDRTAVSTTTEGGTVERASDDGERLELPRLVSFLPQTEVAVM